MLTFVRECDRQSAVWHVIGLFHDNFQQPRVLLLCAVWLSYRGQVLSVTQAQQLRQWVNEHPALSLEAAASQLDELLESWDSPIVGGDVDTCLLRLFPEIGFCEGQSQLLRQLRQAVARLPV